MLTTNTYEVDATVTLQAKFTDLDGVPADPTDVVFRMIEPDDTETTYTFGVDDAVTNPEVGTYLVEWLVTQAGTHCWRFKGTGEVTALRTRRFDAVDGCEDCAA